MKQVINSQEYFTENWHEISKKPTDYEFADNDVQTACKEAMKGATWSFTMHKGTVFNSIEVKTPTVETPTVETPTVVESGLEKLIDLASQSENKDDFAVKVYQAINQDGMSTVDHRKEINWVYDSLRAMGEKVEKANGEPAGDMKAEILKECQKDASWMEEIKNFLGKLIGIGFVVGTEKDQRSAAKSFAEKHLEKKEEAQNQETSL